MPVWEMTASDYEKLKSSEKYHFLHLNATTHRNDKSHYHMTFSVAAAKMLISDLGMSSLKRIHDLNHPEESTIVLHDELRKTCLNAPGFNK